MSFAEKKYPNASVFIHFRHEFSNKTHNWHAWDLNDIDLIE